MKLKPQHEQFSTRNRKNNPSLVTGYNCIKISPWN